MSYGKKKEEERFQSKIAQLNLRENCFVIVGVAFTVIVGVLFPFWLRHSSLVPRGACHVCLVSSRRQRGKSRKEMQRPGQKAVWKESRTNRRPCFFISQFLKEYFFKGKYRQRNYFGVERKVDIQNEDENTEIYHKEGM